jgi:glycine cleavage system regulatory protein
LSSRVLISFFSDDRPGVIHEISRAIEDHGGSWMDSQLSRLGGRFAGVLQAQVPAAQQEALDASLSALVDRGITATLTSAGEAPAGAATTRGLRVLGPDRRGIVQEMTRALQDAGFNVLSLATSVETAPMSGEPLFRAEARIEVLEASRIDELEAQLDALAEAMTLEIDLSPS